MERSIFYDRERAIKIGGTERIISAVSGGTLLGFGLFTPGKARVLMLLGGAALLARGLTGRSVL